MQLPAAGVEYAKWHTDTTDPLEVYLDGQWRSLTAGTETDGVWSAGAGTVHAILVAGPDVASPGAALVLTAGVHPTRIRYTDTPEVLIRSTGPITVR